MVWAFGRPSDWSWTVTTSKIRQRRRREDAVGAVKKLPCPSVRLSVHTPARVLLPVPRAHLVLPEPTPSMQAAERMPTPALARPTSRIPKPTWSGEGMGASRVLAGLAPAWGFQNERRMQVLTVMEKSSCTDGETEEREVGGVPEVMTGSEAGSRNRAPGSVLSALNQGWSPQPSWRQAQSWAGVIDSHLSQLLGYKSSRNSRYSPHAVIPCSENRFASTGTDK